MKNEKKIKKPNWRKLRIKKGKHFLWVSLLFRESLDRITGTIITYNKKFTQGDEIEFSLDEIVYFGNMFKTESNYWKEYYRENGFEQNDSAERYMNKKKPIGNLYGSTRQTLD